MGPGVAVAIEAGTLIDATGELTLLHAATLNATEAKKTTRAIST